MIEAKVKYDFKENIYEIEKYLKENDLDSIELKKVNKLLFKLKNIDTIIENIDEELISDDISNDYNSFNSYCNNFLQGNSSYISSMLTTSDSIMKSLLKYIDFNMILNNKSNIKNYIRNYKYEITKQSSNLENEVSDILSYIKKQKDNIENENTELNNKIKEVNDKLDNLNNNQIDLKHNVDKFIDESKRNIDEIITTEKNSIDELKDNSKKELMENFNTLSEEYKSKFDELLRIIDEKDKKISKLIGIVGEKARIGEYKKNADMSHKERIVWQAITIILFLIAFGLMLYVTITSKDNNKFTVFKYIVSAILMGAATYTAKQASNSRKDEVYYRKQELELASIDVYLENMEPENREEIKKTLSIKMFGQAQNTYTNKYDDKKGFSADDVIKIIESLKNKIQ